MSDDFTQGKINIVELQNPESGNFAAFIFGNATMCDAVVEEDSHKGETLVICGAGPTLADNLEYLDKSPHIWGCNSALTWLLDHGHPCSHGFTIDQTDGMFTDWPNAPDADYLLASTVHPQLTEYLIAHGRRIQFFHNFVGLPNPPDWPYEEMGFEDWLYFKSGLYDTTVRVGYGLNSANRAACLAKYMGFAKIYVLGADCALAANDVLHVNGGGITAAGATSLTFEGMIDGRFWKTKPDMIISAVFWVRMKREMGDRLELIGDTLPNALMDKDDAFLARLPRLTSQDAVDA